MNVMSCYVDIEIERLWIMIFRLDEQKWLVQMLYFSPASAVGHTNNAFKSIR
jgi:hypothetical protein